MLKYFLQIEKYFIKTMKNIFRTIKIFSSCKKLLFIMYKKVFDGVDKFLSDGNFYHFAGKFSDVSEIDLLC